MLAIMVNGEGSSQVPRWHHQGHFPRKGSGRAPSRRQFDLLLRFQENVPPKTFFLARTETQMEPVAEAGLEDIALKQDILESFRYQRSLAVISRRSVRQITARAFELTVPEIVKPAVAEPEPEFLDAPEVPSTPILEVAASTPGTCSSGRTLRSASRQACQTPADTPMEGVPERAWKTPAPSRFKTPGSSTPMEGVLERDFPPRSVPAQVPTPYTFGTPIEGILERPDLPVGLTQRRSSARLSKPKSRWASPSPSPSLAAGPSPRGTPRQTQGKTPPGTPSLGVAPEDPSGTLPQLGCLPEAATGNWEDFSAFSLAAAGSSPGVAIRSPLAVGAGAGTSAGTPGSVLGSPLVAGAVAGTPAGTPRSSQRRMTQLLQQLEDMSACVGTLSQQQDILLGPLEPAPSPVPQLDSPATACGEGGFGSPVDGLLEGAMAPEEGMQGAAPEDALAGSPATPQDFSPQAQPSPAPDAAEGFEAMEASSSDDDGGMDDCGMDDGMGYYDDPDEGEGLPETPAEEGPGGTSTVEVREMEVQTGASLGYRLSAQRALGISPRVFTDVGAGADLGQEFEAGQEEGGDDEGPSEPVRKRVRNSEANQRLRKQYNQRKSLSGEGLRDTGDVRRSNRASHRPLEYWRNEKKVYTREYRSLPTVHHIQTRTPDPRWKFVESGREGKRQRRQQAAAQGEPAAEGEQK